MIQDEDLLAAAAPAKRGGRPPKQRGGAAAPQKEATQLLADMGGMSARERAAALRRAKSLKRGLSGSVDAAAPDPTKKAKVAAAQQAQQQGGEAGGSEAGAQEGGADRGPSPEQEWQEILAGRCAAERL